MCRHRLLPPLIISVLLLLLLHSFSIIVFLTASSNAAVADRKQQSLLELLSGTVFDQEMRSCCAHQLGRQQSEFPVLKCSAIKDGTVAVPNSGYANPNYYSYFWKCVSRRMDNRECCLVHGVTAECLPICNAREPPSFEEMNILLAKACYKPLPDILSSCIAQGRGRIRGAQVILKLDTGGSVGGMNSMK